MHQASITNLNMASADKLKINYCTSREFLRLPGIGKSLYDALFDLAKFAVKKD